jgi:hypothetical protein
MMRAPSDARGRLGLVHNSALLTPESAKEVLGLLELDTGAQRNRLVAVTLRPPPLCEHRVAGCACVSRLPRRLRTTGILALAMR